MWIFLIGYAVVALLIAAVLGIGWCLDALLKKSKMNS